MRKRIKPLTPKDYDGCMNLWKSCKEVVVMEFEKQDLFENVILLNPETCICIKEDKKIIATALGTTDGWRGYIYHLTVKEAYRQQGMGTALVNYINAFFNRQGLSKSYVFVTKRNKVSHQFFDELGWSLRKDIDVISNYILENDS